jgi:hypothetical protein
MDQVHKRMTTEQVKVRLKGYCQGSLDRSAIEEVLGIGRSQPRLPVHAEAEIEKELMLEWSPYARER